MNLISLIIIIVLLYLFFTNITNITNKIEPYSPIIPYFSQSNSSYMKHDHNLCKNTHFDQDSCLDSKLGCYWNTEKSICEDAMIIPPTFR